MSENKKIEIKSLTTYESAFGLIKLAFIIIVVSVCALAGYMTYLSNDAISKLENSIYVLSPTGEISLALRSSEKENRFFEYESHVNKAYTLWYAFDEGTYQKNINDALYLFGDCGSRMLDDYNEEEIFLKIQAKNMQLFVEMDSIKFDTNQTPIFGVIYGKQTIKRPGGKLIRHMDCRFNLIDTQRSRENPHGVKIENWEVINAEIITD